MSAERARFDEIKEILLAARSLAPEARESFVRERAGSDAELAREVLSLLAHESSSASILETGAVPRMTGRDATHPESIGPYRIIDVLGEGGMGVVYAAKQEEPVRRTVALKLVRGGLHSDRVLRRFEWERQSLARMHHQHIAAVLDAGSDEKGRPWFVMPLVDGEPMVRYCDARGLGLSERVNLFVDVSRAVEHAHQRGILHRDLKPSNILVREIDGQHVPTVIDFGISKTLQSEEDRGELTLDGQAVGTPAYMSPEQLRGDESAIDTRSDVYALGVVLYELLTGRHPWTERGDRVPLDDLSAAIPAPSTVASSELPARADGDGTQSPRLSARQLRGDLDTICLKALRTEPARRYATVGLLADDLVRWRDGMPVTARPDSIRYRLGKFARRHPLGVAMGGMLLAVLLGGAVFLAWHGQRLERERDRAVVAEQRARAEAKATQRVATFLEELFMLAEDVSGASELSALDMLQQGVSRIPVDLDGEPDVQARLYRALGDVHHALSSYAEAETLLVAALDQVDEARSSMAESDYVDFRAETLLILSTVLHDVGRPAEAARMDSLAIETLREAGRRDDPLVAQALAALGIDLQVQGQVEEAIPLVRESLAMQERIDDTPNSELAWGHGTLGYLHFKLGDLRESEREFVVAVDLAREAFAGEDHFDLLHALNNYGGLMLHLERFDEAERVLGEALAMAERLYVQREHPAIARQLANLARVHVNLGRHQIAREQAERAVGIAERTQGPSHPRTSATIATLARIATAEGHTAEAESLLREVRAIRVASLDEDHPLVVNADTYLGRHWLDRGRPEVALPYLKRVVAWCERNDQPRHYRRAEAMSDYGACLVALDRIEEAKPILEKAVSILSDVYGREHSETRRARERLAQIAD